jgi:hypothetical protein
MEGAAGVEFPGRPPSIAPPEGTRPAHAGEVDGQPPISVSASAGRAPGG